MKKLLLTLLLSFPAYYYAGAAELSPEIKRLMASLDSTLNVRENFVREKQLRIDAMRPTLSVASTPEEEYLAQKWLFSQYKTFNIDSASVFADRKLTVAKRLGSSDKITESRIDRSYVFAATGRLMEAMDVLDGIRSETLSNELKLLYFGQLYYLYSCQAEFLDSEEDALAAYEREFRYADSTLTVISRSDPYYDVYAGWKDYRDGNYSSAVPAIQERVERTRIIGNPEVQLMYLLSRNYEALGDKDRQLVWLLKATIADIRLANQDNLTMKFLSKELKDRGYVKEAYHYLYECFTMAIEAHDRVRMISLLRDMGGLQGDYDTIRERQSHSLQIAFAALGVLFLALIAALFFIRKQMKALSSQHSQTKKANEALDKAVRERDETIAELSSAQNLLKEQNAELDRLNDILKDKNTLKEEYIGFALAQSSDYITKLDEYRKDIYRMIRLKNYDEVRMRTSNPIQETELKAFYKTFDTVFLKVYPDFVKDLNALLLEDQQIIPKEEGRLNAELRIFALVRLGITDSGKIADFLHISIQTVYNNRLKVRQKAKDREHFDEAVRGLGV